MAEPWIRVHANLAGRPIVWRAVEVLSVSSHEAIGLLVQFWGSVSQHGNNGLIETVPDAQVEAWAGWTRKRGKFAAFIRAYHLDDEGRVNEWDDYAGKLEDRKEKDRNRKRKSRGSHADSPALVTLDSAPTKRNETKRSEVDVGASDSDAVEIPGEPGLTATYLTICANSAIATKWREQVDPLMHSGAYDLVESLARSGIEWQVARVSIYRQCRDSKLSSPPKSINYFRPGIEADWKRELARRALASSGESAPVIAVVDAPRRPVVEHWSDKKKREEQEATDRALAVARSGNVDVRRDKPDGAQWYARMLAEAKAAGIHPTLYAYDRMHEHAEVNRASA